MIEFDITMPETDEEYRRRIAATAYQTEVSEFMFYMIETATGFMLDVVGNRFRVDRNHRFFDVVISFDMLVSCSHWGCFSAACMWDSCQRAMRRLPDGRHYLVF